MEQQRGGGRIKWTEEMNTFLEKSENSPRLENGRKKGYIRMIKELTMK